MFSGSPINYQDINVYNASVSPSTMHSQNTGLTNFFAWKLMEKAMSIFKWELPEHWNKQYFLAVLYYWGYMVVFETQRFGVIAQGCGLRGYDVWYWPTTAVVTNMRIRGIKEIPLHTHGELLFFQQNLCGLWGLVSYYADLMAITSEAAGVNLYNTKLAYVIGVQNKRLAETWKKMYDRIASGEPNVVTDPDLFNPDGTPRWQMFNNNVGGTYITDRLLIDLKKIENMFDSEIGIPNSNTEKKERQIKDEVNSNNVSVKTRAELWMDTLKAQIDKVKKLWPDLKLSVDWRFDNGMLVNNGIIPVGQGGMGTVYGSGGYQPR